MWLKCPPFQTLRIDLPTRWSSTFFMLQFFIPYREVVSLFLTTYTDLNIVDDDDVHAKFDILVDLLSIFHKYTRLFSGVYYLTIHAVLSTLIVIATTFMKYFETIPMLFLVANMLDPRVKATSLHAGLNLICDYFTSLELPNIRLDAKKMYTSSLDALTYLYDLYECEASNMRVGSEKLHRWIFSFAYDYYSMISTSPSMTIKANEVVLSNTTH